MISTLIVAWQRRFGADPEIVGQTLTLDKEPWVVFVVGIMPPGFTPIGAGPSPIYTPYVSRNWLCFAAIPD